jgi:diguanylate cyclase (GGDEF)-like protein
MNRQNISDLVRTLPSKQAQPEIKLFIIGADQEDCLTIKNSTASVGKSFGNDTQINNQFVSRRHAMADSENSKYSIEDLGTTNRILINNNPIAANQKVQVEEGVPIVIGDVVISLGRRCSKDFLPANWLVNHSQKKDETSNYLSNDRRTRTDRETLKLIYSLSMTMLDTLDIDKLGKNILACMFSYLKKVDSGHVLFVQGGSEKLIKIATRSKQGVRNLEMNYISTLVKQVMKEGKPINITDDVIENEKNTSENKRIPRVRSVLCVPLIRKSRIRGAIVLQSLSIGHAFRKEDISFTVGLCVPATLAIENALLYSKRKKAEDALKKAHDGLEIAVRKRTSDLVKAKEEVEKLSITDEMSGLYNYRYFMQSLETEYARAVRYNHLLGLMMIDIDHFKSINDSYGHQCGDSVIKEIALLIKQYVRTTDIVARYGGDEMAVILPETTKKSALDVADKLKGAVECFNFNWRGKSLNVRISLGLAIAPNPEFKESFDLVNASDRALYQAKKAGRNLVVAI